MQTFSGGGATGSGRSRFSTASTRRASERSDGARRCCSCEAPPARDAASAAVVGTRQATPQGARRARELATGLAARGVPVTSGLADSIDTAAHTGRSLRAAVPSPFSERESTARTRRRTPRCKSGNRGQRPACLPVPARHTAVGHHSRCATLSSLPLARRQSSRRGAQGGLRMTAQLALRHGRRVFLAGRCCSTAGGGPQSRRAAGALTSGSSRRDKQGIRLPHRPGRTRAGTQPGTVLFCPRVY